MLLGTGWTQQQVAYALLVDIETLRTWVKHYKRGCVKRLCSNKYKGGQTRLTTKQLALKSHLNEKLYMQVSEIINYVKKTYDIHYSISGMTDLLHRMGFVYKKPQVVPSKANADAQDSINAQSTIALLKQIELKHDDKTEVIYIICDNARYYRSKLVKEYLEGSRIMLVFLPPYSPNLNLIERLWKFLKRRCYTTPILRLLMSLKLDAMIFLSACHNTKVS